MSIAVGPIWSVITFANNARTNLPPLESPGQIKFYLQLFFFEIKSTFVDSNTRES